MGSGVFSFRDFNVVSFNDFIANTGDVEGRVAAKRDVTLGNGFSIGFLLDTATSQPDKSLPYALVVGRNLVWGSGSLHPDGSGLPLPGNREDMFVGGNAQVDATLVGRRTGGPCGSPAQAHPGCLDDVFERARTCYNGFATTLSNQADNVAKKIEWSNLELTCSAQLNRYVVSLTPAEMSQFTYTTLVGCNFQAEWIINIRGTEAVEFRGDTFPGLPGGVVYNVIGNRAVSITETKVNGHVLAPTATINQPGGVIVGKVVAGDITFSLQINKPDCPNPGVVTVTTTTTTPTHEGDTEVPVAALSAIRAGDVVAISGNDYTVVSAYGNTITLDQGLKTNNNERTLVSANVNGNTRRPDVSPEPSSASVVAISFALFVILALLF
jgi:choice-of-anchor A domain-containing protein